MFPCLLAFTVFLWFGGRSRAEAVACAAVVSWALILCVSAPAGAAVVAQAPPLAAASTPTTGTDADLRPREAALYAISPPAGARRVLTLLLVPAWLVVGFVRVDAEFRVAENIGVKAAIATFGDFALQDNVFGAQLNWYAFGRFERGWQLGLEYVAGKKRSADLFIGGAPKVSTTPAQPLLRITLVGPHIGYKLIAENGLSIELQAGVHAALIRRFEDDVEVSSQWRTLPMIATNFGWSL
jgi:hypothetical protein